MLKKIGGSLFLFVILTYFYDGYAIKKKTPSAALTITQESPVAPTNNTSPTLTGLMAMMTNYIWRGVTQTNNIPAFQGSVTATYPLRITNFYVNLLGSNVSTVENRENLHPTLEIDTSIGITDTLWKNFYYNINFVNYSYPKAQELNYNELLINITYYFIKLLYGYSANEFNSHSSGHYYNIGVTFDLPKQYFLLEGLNLTATAGYFAMPKIVGNSYNDYAVVLTETVKNYVFALQWTGTNHRLFNNSLDANQIAGIVIFNF